MHITNQNDNKSIRIKKREMSSSIADINKEKSSFMHQLLNDYSNERGYACLVVNISFVYILFDPIEASNNVVHAISRFKRGK